MRKQESTAPAWDENASSAPIEIDLDEAAGWEVKSVESPEIFGVLVRSELESQIAMAHAHRRKLSVFRADLRSTACGDASIAKQCTYVLKRSGKQITGPSIRFAELVAFAYGGLRRSAYVVDEGARFIKVHATAHDLERNNVATYEVSRRITTKEGHRYGDDMIGVTIAAAVSIGMRNAIFGIVPRALWEDVYQDVIATAAGGKGWKQDVGLALDWFAKKGFDAARVCSRLGREGVDDLTAEDVVVMKHWFDDVRARRTKVEDLFADPKPTVSAAASAGAAIAAAAQGIGRDEDAP